MQIIVGCVVSRTSLGDVPARPSAVLIPHLVFPDFIPHLSYHILLYIFIFSPTSLLLLLRPPLFISPPLTFSSYHHRIKMGRHRKNRWGASEDRGKEERANVAIALASQAYTLTNADILLIAFLHQYFLNPRRVGRKRNMPTYPGYLSTMGNYCDSYIPGIQRG